MQGTAELPHLTEGRTGEQLVAVRPDVLSDVEHAVGNLLQRLHHVARAARAGLGTNGERLEGTLEDLERLLELLFDYISPVDVQVRPLDSERVIESLLAQVRAQRSGPVSVADIAPVRVLADPRALSRSFLLLGQACGPEWEAAAEVAVEVVLDGAWEHAAFRVRAQGAPAAAPTVHHSVAAAVAGRLVELQGGELRYQRGEGGVTCLIVLPAASPIHGDV